MKGWVQSCWLLIFCCNLKGPIFPRCWYLFVIDQARNDIHFHLSHIDFAALYCQKYITVFYSFTGALKRQNGETVLLLMYASVSLWGGVRTLKHFLKVINWKRVERGDFSHVSQLPWLPLGDSQWMWFLPGWCKAWCHSPFMDRGPELH